MHRYLPHMQAEQQQAVACTRHIRASVEKKDLRKPEFPVPRKWLVGERTMLYQHRWMVVHYVFQCGNKIIWDFYVFSTYRERQTAEVSLAGAGTYLQCIYLRVLLLTQRCEFWSLDSGHDELEFLWFQIVEHWWNMTGHVTFLLQSSQISHFNSFFFLWTGAIHTYGGSRFLLLQISHSNGFFPLNWFNMLGQMNFLNTTVVTKVTF